MKQINYIAYTSDGEYLLTVDSNTSEDRLSFWHPLTGQQLETLPMGGGEGCIGLACSPNGKYILCGDTEGILFLWEMEKYSVIDYRRIVLDDLDEVFAVGFSHDSQYAYVSVNRSIQIWKVPEWRKVKTLSAYYGSVAEFTLDDQSIVIGAPDGLQRISLITGEIIQKAKLASEPVIRLSFSPAGNLCYAWDTFGISIWDLHRNHVLFWSERSIHNAYAAGDISSDGKFLVFVLGKRVLFVDVETKQVIQEYIGHSDQVINVIFSPDAKHIVTASWDGTARMWDVQTGTELQRFVP